MKSDMEPHTNSDKNFLAEVEREPNTENDDPNTPTTPNTESHDAPDMAANMVPS